MMEEGNLRKDWSNNVLRVRSETCNRQEGTIHQLLLYYFIAHWSKKLSACLQLLIPVTGVR